MALVGIALGSNVGDRRGHLDYAVARLRSVLRDLRVSRFLDTEPIDVVGTQALFLNGAAAGGFEGAPQALLADLHRIEAERGRERPHPGAARTLDLDLIFFDRERIDEPGLVLPHPRFRERRFVLDPLAEVAADWCDPVTGLSVAQLLDRLDPAR